MKTLKITLLSLLTILMIHACKEDDSTQPTNSTNNNSSDTLADSYFRATLDGVSTEFSPFAQMLDSTIYVTGMKNNSFPQFIIDFDNRHLPATYIYGERSPVDTTLLNPYFFYNLSEDSVLYQKNGKITLVKLDLENRIIRGTFEGVLDAFRSNSNDSIVVMDGEFNVFY